MKTFVTTLFIVVYMILLLQGLAISSEYVVGKVISIDEDNQQIVLEVMRSSDSSMKAGTSLTVKAAGSIDISDVKKGQVVRITIDLTEDSLCQLQRLEPCQGRCGADRTGVRFRLHKGISGRGTLGHGPRYRGRHGR